MTILKNQKFDYLYDLKVRKDYRIELHKRKDGEKLSIVSDTMFKAMFQNEKRLMYSCYLLSFLLDISYEELKNNLELSKNELDKDKENDKGLRSDYVAKIHGTTINIEMNNNSDVNTMERNIEYADRLYSSGIERGRKSKYHPVIQINFNNFSFHGIEKIIDIYKVQNDEGKVLIDKKTYINIYLPNLREKCYYEGIEELSELERYLMVLIETDIAYAKKIGKGRKIMEDYIKEAEDAVLKDDLLRSYDKELAYGDERFRDGKEEGRIEGKEEGRIEGKEEGRIEGIKEGKEETQREIINTMLEKGLTDEEIIEYTHCTKELLNEIKD